MAERNFRTERYIYVGSDYDSGIEMPDGKFIVPHEMYDSDVAKLDIDYPNNGLFELKTTQNGDGSTPENGSNTPSGNASNQSKRCSSRRKR